VHHRNCTRNAAEAYRTAKREDKRIHKNKKEKYTEDELKQLEDLRHTNKSKVFCMSESKYE
jgi:hypothetical protein